MKNKTMLQTALLSLGLITTFHVHAGKSADPFLVKFVADKLEVANNDDNTRMWEIQMWAGTDWHKLWLYSEGESEQGETASENMLTYSHPIAPFWDIQVGLARDEQPGASYNWGVLGFNGLAPYYFESQAHLLIGEDGTLGVRAGFEYEALFTQFLILTPEIEFSAYSDDIPEMGIGGGLSTLSAGLRLRYEIKREFAPYIGVQWSQSYGKTADYLRSAGEESGDTVWVAGVRIWF
ncbi:MAG TPA: copper resistance protein B [Sulfurivirga caldicuralii]|nr:copper resistance protein B [Sulfurivirga caldicuralii]